MTAHAHFDVVNTKDLTTVSITGEVDLSNAEEVAGKLFDTVKPESLGLVLDISEVRYMDSSGISVLFEMSRTLSARRQSMSLVVPEASPLRPLIDLTRIQLAVNVSETVEEAKEAATRP
ncbi:MAG TPA: STAS domain-containing protein [Actinomycetota bacterium]|nr:STAS domain-containing protein [Actinomycetota bacterium]